MLKAFFTYVRPILEYCSPVWSPHLKYLIDRIESVQKFFTKRLPGLWNVPYPKRLELLKLQFLEYCRISYDLRLCYQSLHSYCDTTIRLLAVWHIVLLTTLEAIVVKFSSTVVRLMLLNFTLQTELLMYGTVYPSMLSLHCTHLVMFLQPIVQDWSRQVLCHSLASLSPICISASEMTYVVSSGALNSTHSLTR